VPGRIVSASRDRGPNRLVATARESDGGRFAEGVGGEERAAPSGPGHGRILLVMARSKDTTKEPGRIKQMWQVLQMTRRHDPSVTWILILVVVAPIAAGVLLAIFLSSGNAIGFALYIITGVLAGVLLFLVVLGRRAERAAYSQIVGQPGAVGAVLKNSLRGGWIASEMPVNVSPRTQDAVYRAVGRGGVVLIGEGPRSRTQKMLEDERKSVVRFLQNVPVSFVYVGPDAESTPLHKLPSTIRRTKRALRKAEVFAVNNRLKSLGKNSLPIPKGMDPMKVRAPRPR
jgi:hypothetical protein